MICPLADQEQEQAETPVQQTVQAFGTVKTKQTKGIMVDLPASIEKYMYKRAEGKRRCADYTESKRN